MTTKPQAAENLFLIFAILIAVIASVILGSVDTFEPLRMFLGVIGLVVFPLAVGYTVFKFFLKKEIKNLETIGFAITISILLAVTFRQEILEAFSRISSIQGSLTFLGILCFLFIFIMANFKLSHWIVSHLKKRRLEKTRNNSKLLGSTTKIKKTHRKMLGLRSADLNGFLVSMALVVFFILVLTVVPVYSILGPTIYFMEFALYCLAFIIVMTWFVRTYYSREKFVKIYDAVSHPWFSLLILGLLYIIGDPGYRFNVLTTTGRFLLSLIFSLSFASFAFIVECFWLHHLKRDEHRHRTAWIYHFNQTRFKWYLLFLPLGFFVAIFVNTFFGVAIIIHCFILIFSTTFILNGEDIKKYCKTGLFTIKERLSPDRAEYKIFPTVIGEFNKLTKEVYPSGEPEVLNSDRYTKALFISAISMDKQRLKNTGKSIEEMAKALDSKPEKRMFWGFINGLNLLTTGKKLKPQEQPKDMFEIRTGHEKPLKWIHGKKVLSAIMILAIVVPTYVTIRTQEPEFGYRLIKDFHENLAKFLFPIGEVSLPQQYFVKYTALEGPSEWYSSDKLNGKSYGEYSFKVLNEHRGRIMINDLSFTFTTPITGIHTEDTSSHTLGTENIELEIETVTIQSPSEPVIIGEYECEDIDVSLAVRYDLRAIREDLEQLRPATIVVERWVQISISYKILGKDITENISEDLGRFNFVFLAEPFLQ